MRKTQRDARGKGALKRGASKRRLKKGDECLGKGGDAGGVELRSGPDAVGETPTAADEDVRAPQKAERARLPSKAELVTYPKELPVSA